MVQVFLTEEELTRESNLFSPNDTSIKPLKGVRFNLYSFIEEEKKAAEAAKSGGQGNKPAIFVPPSC